MPFGVVELGSLPTLRRLLESESPFRILEFLGGEAVAEGRETELDSVAVYDRRDAGETRAVGSIGFSSVRAGNIVGDHAVLFAADEEIVELRHRALDRAVFARGALRAAKWIAQNPAGFYSMNDVLGL